MSSNVTIDVEIISGRENPGEFGVIVRSEDRSPLTPQQILDAVSDALLYEYGTLEVFKKYDA